MIEIYKPEVKRLNLEIWQPDSCMKEHANLPSLWREKVRCCEMSEDLIQTSSSVRIFFSDTQPKVQATFNEYHYVSRKIFSFHY